MIVEKEPGSNEFIDKETGEIFQREIVYRRINEKVLLIKNKTDGQKRLGRNIKHVKMRTAKRQIELWKRLSIDARGMLASMLLFCDWQTNTVQGDGIAFPVKVPLTWAQIGDYCHISKPTYNRIKKELEQQNVIRYYLDPSTNKRTVIAVNPIFALKGEQFSSNLLALFENEKDVEEDNETSKNGE